MAAISPSSTQTYPWPVQQLPQPVHSNASPPANHGVASASVVRAAATWGERSFDRRDWCRVPSDPFGCSNWGGVVDTVGVPGLGGDRGGRSLAPRYDRENTVDARRRRGRATSCRPRETGDRPHPRGRRVVRDSAAVGRTRRATPAYRGRSLRWEFVVRAPHSLEEQLCSFSAENRMRRS